MPFPTPHFLLSIRRFVRAGAQYLRAQPFRCCCRHPPRLTPVVSAIARQVEFWQELSKEHPNLRRLEDLGGDIASSIQLADHCYEDILRLSPHSLPAIRAYAKFLLEARVWMGGRACKCKCK